MLYFTNSISNENSLIETKKLQMNKKFIYKVSNSELNINENNYRRLLDQNTFSNTWKQCLKFIALILKSTYREVSSCI